MKEKPVSAKKDLVSRNNYALILLNDEVNSFEHVIKSLVEVCGHDPVQAEQCAVITHFRGSCDVKTGRSSVLLAMKRGLGNRNLNSEVKPI
ncbi:MAG TPA: ATP-dependent Clp protease adaptor ClpS [Bacteroidales bacterium]|nr:ATP-dependent Clp protease adaptor ClpS [Bacteroidales bacterium]